MLEVDEIKENHQTSGIDVCLKPNRTACAAYVDQIRKSILNLIKVCEINFLNHDFKNLVMIF